jgi:hypothetical protein
MPLVGNPATSWVAALLDFVGHARQMFADRPNGAPSPFVRGEDLGGLPLCDRKKRLARLLGGRRLGIVLSDHTDDDGATIFRHVCGYALANKGHDTRAIQGWLGHRSITSGLHGLGAQSFQGFLAGLAMAGISAEALDLSSEKWEDIERYNSCLAGLVERRKPAVAVQGPLVKSKTAWRTRRGTGCATRSWVLAR